MALIDNLVNLLTDPRVLFFVSIALFLASIQFASVWTKPKVALGILAFLLVFGAYAATHKQVAETLSKPDNIPIVIIIAALGFLYWLAMRQAVQNDARLAAGQPPREAAEKNRKVLVWPDLVYTELIAMVVATVILVAWSVLIRAPLEEPANAARTPNPSKAPWYFLGLQEILVYFDPWWAGVGLPGTIMMGLIAIPYIDRNPKGNGYYTLRERKAAITVFCFGFFILWLLLAFIGTFLRGPGWNFFGLFEDWDHNFVAELNNVNLSQIIWVDLLGQRAPKFWLAREMWGFLAVGFYMGVLPVLIAMTVGKKLLRELGALRFGSSSTWRCSWRPCPEDGAALVLNLKYVVYLPEILLNI
jgi:hypothetical protein